MLQIKCFKCQTSTKVSALQKAQGAELDCGHQVDYFCPNCKRLVLCDTSGNGHYALQNSSRFDAGSVPPPGGPMEDGQSIAETGKTPIYIEEGQPPDC